LISNYSQRAKLLSIIIRNNTIKIMNKNTTAIVIVIALVGIIGLVIYSKKNTIITVNTPPASTSNTATNETPSPNEARQPGAPITITNQIVAPTDTAAAVMGAVTPRGALTTYWFEYGLTPTMGSKTLTQHIGSGYVAIAAPGYISGLKSDTTYYYRIVAENQYGKNVGVQYTFTTPHGTPALVGSAPRSKTLSANSISRTTANIHGEVTPNKNSTQYWFEYGTSTSLGNTTAFVSLGDGSAAVAVSASLSSLDPVTTYYFRLNAQNQFGTVNGAILSFKTSGPASTTEPDASTRSASNIQTSKATFNGTVNPNGTETTYWFEYATDSLIGGILGQTTNKVSLGSGTKTVSVKTDVSNLTPKTTYYFQLVAQNEHGTVRGDRLSFKTK
jgi:hypothetical protein